jgi:hypothetical protein
MNETRQPKFQEPCGERSFGDTAFHPNFFGTFRRRYGCAAVFQVQKVQGFASGRTSSGGGKAVINSHRKITSSSPAAGGRNSISVKSFGVHCSKDMRWFSKHSWLLGQSNIVPALFWTLQASQLPFKQLGNDERKI